MPEVDFPLDNKRIWIAGHRGMVGSAILRKLGTRDCEVLTASRGELDLRRQADVERWVAEHRPDAIILAAARVGGILANDTYPKDFLFDNLAIQLNVIEAAYRAGVAKLLVLGSSCIYPREATQPIEESALLTGPLEPTNEWYAIAKIAGIKLGQAYRRQHGCNFISAMPTNLYGPGDNFDLQTSHVLPALMRRMHDAKIKGAPEVVIWGTGKPRREFLHVDDCANALIFLLENYSAAGHVNVGSGTDISIQELALIVARVVGYTGTIVNDLSKPDGTPRKLMSNRILADMRWSPTVSLEDGIRRTYDWFLQAESIRLTSPIGES